MERRITDPPADTALVRMELCIGRTVSKNERALECAMGALFFCFLGYNVGRAFWSIGRGGVWKYLFTSLINNAFYPNHGFSDCAALYKDDAAGKYVDLLPPFCVWASQEGSEGVRRRQKPEARSIQEIPTRRPDGSATPHTQWLRSRYSCADSSDLR